MRKIIHSGYFAFDQTKMVEVVMLYCDARSQ